jgi:hypothetical protein
MKKLMVVLVLLMGGLIVEAQRTPVKVADLQKSIIDNINKDYVGFTIKDATKVVENNVITYDVVIAKGTKQETLCYDKDGMFLKKMESKAGSVTASGKSAKHPMHPKNK